MEKGTTRVTALRVLTLLAAGLMTAGCGNDETVQSDDNGRVALHVTSGIVTRAVDNTWQVGDAIGLFMLNGSEADTYVNVKYTTPDNGTSAAFTAADEKETVYLPVDGTTRDFIAYYPYQQGLTADQPVYAINLADQSNLPAIDLMVAEKVTGKSRTDYTAPFVFTHRLSKVVMDIRPGVGLTAADLAGLTASISGQPVTGTFNVLTGTDAAASTSEPATIALQTAADGRSAQGIVFPSTDYSGMALKFHTVAAGDYTWPLTGSTMAQRFEAGKKYLYTITVNKTNLSVSASISDWIPGNATGDEGSAE